MKPETAQMLLKILKHPATKITENAITGSMIGGLAGSLLYKDQYKKLQEIIESKENKIDSNKYVAEHFPDLHAISTREDASKVDLGIIDNFLLKHTIPKKEEDWDNAYYLPNKDNSAVLVPKRVNKYILGHELGHHKDLEGTDLGFLSSGTIGNITGSILERERNAWEKSPIKIDKKGEEIKNLALGSYENQQKYVRLGLGLGLAAGAAKSFGPKILELIRSGNIR